MRLGTELNLLASALVEGDSKLLNTEVNRAVSSAESLRKFFRDLFCFSALYQRSFCSNDGEISHPLIELNALKNLAALTLNSPSLIIAEKAIVLCQKSIESCLESELPKPTLEEISQPLITQEFIYALGTGDEENAKNEAVKISAVSDNPVAVIEIIMEVAIQHMDQLGAFVYGVYRAGVFAGGSESSKFTNLLLSALTDSGWPSEKEFGEDILELESFTDDVLTNGDIPAVNLFSTAVRLWYGKSVRQANYRKCLGLWMQTKFHSSSDLERKDMPVKSPSSGDFITMLEGGEIADLSGMLIQARNQNKWLWPTQIAELWISSSKSDELSIDFLDALQSIARTASPHTMTLVAERLVDAHGIAV